MEERVMQFRVGVLVLLTGLFLFLLVMIIGAMPDLGARSYTIHVQFESAPGVQIDTPVRKSGVLIGRVTQVSLDKHTVLVTASIKQEYKIYRSETIMVNSASLFGDAVLDVVKKKPDPRTEETGHVPVSYRETPAGVMLVSFTQPTEPPADDDDVIGDDEVFWGETATNPLQVLVNLEDDVEQTLSRLSDASDNVGLLASGINTVLTGEDQKLSKLINGAERSFTEVSTAMNSLNKLVGDPVLKRDLERALSQIPELVHDMRIAADGMRRMAASAETNLDNLRGFTEPLGENGPELVANLTLSTRNLDQMLAQVAGITEAISDRQGTVGQLIYNRDVYDRLDRAVENIEEITVKAKPIVQDIRTFTDKIARDPRQLGIKGALDRRQTGVK